MNTKLRSFLFVLLAMGVAGFTFSRRATTEPLPAEPRSAEAVTGTTNITLNYQGQLNNGTAPVNGSATFIFKLYGTLTGGTACWTETQTLNVQNGLFNALLGSVTAIPDSCVVNDTYLELVVNNTTLTPRELVNQFANTIASGTTTRGGATISSNLQVSGDNTQPVATVDLVFGPSSIIIGQMPYSSSMLGGYSLANAYGSTITSGTDWAFFGLKGDTVDNKDAVIAWGDDTNKLSFIFGHDETNPVEVMSLSKEGILNVAGNADIGGGVTVGGDIYVGGVHARSGLSTNFISSPINTDLGIDAGLGSANILHLSDNVDISGNLNVGGTCSASVQGKAVADATCGQISANSVQTGAVIEANLQTDEEKAMARIERFEQGDLLCWSAEDQHSELCSTANTPLIVAVADKNGKPAIAGVEPIKVIGSVKAGDLLVASDVAGYAMVNNNAASGTIIAKALNNFDDGQGLVLCKIISQ